MTAIPPRVTHKRELERVFSFPSTGVSDSSESQRPEGSSHLHDGFRLVSALRSVREQRRIQGELLAELLPSRLLSVGCGYGDELAELLRCHELQCSVKQVLAIDLVDVEDKLSKSSIGNELGQRLSFAQFDLTSPGRFCERRLFDLAQCGFVFHEIPWHRKSEVLHLVADCVHDAGHVLISDMFLPDETTRGEGVRLLYERFFADVEEARRSGQISHQEWEMLMGDGESPGLVRAERVALDEEYLESAVTLAGRAKNAGLVLLQEVRNPTHPMLVVQLFGKERRHDSAHPNS